MPLQTFSFEMEVPELGKWESELEVRRPKAGEAYFNSKGQIAYADSDYLPGCLANVLRPVWKWPEFVKPGCWIAMDKNGNWAFYDEEPHITLNGGNEWLPRGAAFVMAGEVANFFNFTPPPCTDWKLSKRQKPL